MRQLTCEMCNSTDFAKQNGFFVCQSCGMKYSPEDAKAMINAESPAAPVTPVEPNQVSSLLKLAKTAFESDNYAEAENFCNQALTIDANNHEAWRIKGKSIVFLGTDTESRVNEVYNCLVTSYNVLDDAGKDEKRNTILEDINEALAIELIYRVENVEVLRPTGEVTSMVKRTYQNVMAMQESVYKKLDVAEDSRYLSLLTNKFISKINDVCKKAWETTVGYNYYRDAFDRNNHILDIDEILPISWGIDNYRPDSGILKTYIDELGNLDNLLRYAEALFNNDTQKEEKIRTYQNMLFLIKHKYFAKSYKRMVETTTNGYGAVTNREEYWCDDERLSEDAKNEIRLTVDKITKKLSALLPDIELIAQNKEKIEQLKKEVLSLVTVRKVKFGLLQIILIILSFLLTIYFAFATAIVSLTEGEFIIQLFIITIVLAIVCWVLAKLKTPSAEEVTKNCLRRDEIRQEIEKLTEENEKLSNRLL